MKGKKNTEKLVTILLDTDFCWYPSQIEKAKVLWECGVGIKEMSKIFKRSCMEVMLLLMHLDLEGEIEKREGYVWGNLNKK
ncbi:hypothetical protein [Clostridium intestinale]|jgi:hypothetical protein|uniref:DprA winged helix domain-containing protein n=1 Tax=Clostridium intestinale TaxID=36845 RepID=A0A7D6VN88_9CLOT|nr:hypothetical protein [Clostridium intestinale]QLY77809.1 hypothetical protein HZF06_11865 [Clostridium intestinale]